MQVDVTVQVELESPLHVGSGSLADSLADKPLIKDARGLALIPGSALKGKARHAAEQVARALIAQWDWGCDAPYPDRMCQGNDPSRLCPVCRIFGAPAYPAPLRFGNLTLEPVEGLPKLDYKWCSEPEVRAGVGLNRARRVAQDDVLYTVETHRASPALVFQGFIQGELAEKRQVALLAAALRAVRTLGGNRSRGLGWCRLTLTVNLDGIEQDIPILLRELAQWSS